MGYLCTLNAALAALNSTSTTSNDKLMDAILRVSNRVEKRYPLEPTQRVRAYDATADYISRDGFELFLYTPLLEIDSVTVAGTTVSSLTYETAPVGETPYTRLVKTSGDIWTTTGGASRRNAIRITGKWGWHPDYDNAWVADTTLNGSINASVTSVTFTSATNLLPGMLIRVEDEYMRLLSKSTNTGTVKRGVNGTTAAAHNTLTAIDYYVPEPQISGAVARLAAYAVHRIGQFEDKKFDLETGIAVQYAWDMLPDARAVINDALPKFRHSFAV